MQIPASVSHVLLDIEGTTCPVSFVSEVLFPYARAQLGPFLKERAEQAQVQELVTELEQAWRAEGNPEVLGLGARPFQRLLPGSGLWLWCPTWSG